MIQPYPKVRFRRLRLFFSLPPKPPKSYGASRWDRLVDAVLNQFNDQCELRDKRNRKSGVSYCVRPKNHPGQCRAYNGKHFNGVEM